MNARGLLRSAGHLVTLRFFLQQIALAFVAFALFAVWLRMPDGSVLSVIGSVVLAMFTLFIAFAGEAWLLLRIRTLGSRRRPIMRGALALLIAMLLLLPLSALLRHAGAGDALRAGYLNSRFPAGMRNAFSYRHLFTLLQQTWDSLFWAGAIVLAMAGVAITVSTKPLPAWGRMLSSLTAWIVLSLATILASELTMLVMGWTPGHGLRKETFSLAVRLATTILLDALLLCFSLALLVVLAQQSDARYLPVTTESGTPDLIQPRTAGIP